MQLLHYQKEVVDKIVDLITNNDNCILISGISGCGKSFTLKHLENEIDKKQYQITFFDGDYQYDDREYYPLKKGLFGDDNAYVDLIVGSAAEASKEVPVAGNVISYIIKYFSNRKESNGKAILNNEEQNILAKIKQKLKKSQNIFIFDNIHWWDRRSLQFLKLILTNSDLFDINKYKNLKLIFSVTSNQEAIHSDLLNEIINNITFKRFDFPTISYSEFKENLFYQTFQTFSDSQINLLFNLVNGHLQVFYEVINEINNNNFDFTSRYESNKQYLSTILEKRLRSLGATSTQIIKTLEYASIIGITFSLYELKHTTNSTENDIVNIINKTTSLSITKNTNEIDYIKFAHDIIRDIFKTYVDKQHLEYYKTLSLCLKEIKPDQYLRRARYLMQCLESDEASTIYLLEAIKQIRLYGKILKTTRLEMNPILNSLQIEYIEIMQEAYLLYSTKEYSSASKKLNLILDIFPSELLAERDILRIRCYSKTMASNEIYNCIEKYHYKQKNTSFNSEKDVWERYSQVLMIAYAHLGDIDTARGIESEILQNLSNRLNYDECAAKRLNIIKRASNSIHSIEMSSVFVKDAFDYFGNSSYGFKDIRYFYTSLVNYSTILINQGEFEEAYKLTLNGFNIENNNQDIVFPRVQLLRNNYILSGYLSNNLTVDECITLYNKLIDDLPIISERLFYKSNLSIFWALKEEPLIAYNILSEEAKLHYDEDEKEGLYKYRVITNTSIYQFLLGNNEIAIKQLESITGLTKRLINGSYFYKKNELLIKLINSNSSVTGQEMINILFNETPSFQDKSWKYFGLGYSFMAVCNWDMEE